MSTIEDTADDTFGDPPEVVPEHDEYDAHEDHKPDSYYVIVALVLAVITGLEVSLSYIDIGPLFLPLLLVLMAIKFFTVVSIFMHLRFDNRIFKWCFYSGLGLALGVYIITLFTFQFFVS